MYNNKVCLRLARTKPSLYQKLQVLHPSISIWPYPQSISWNKPEENKYKQLDLLFASSSTLVCCRTCGKICHDDILHPSIIIDEWSVVICFKKSSETTWIINAWVSCSFRTSSSKEKDRLNQRKTMNNRHILRTDNNSNIFVNFRLKCST